MKLSPFDTTKSQEVIDLFSQVFTDSEGKEEGDLIGSLVSDLIATTNKQDLVGFVACSEKRIVGSIFFTRFLVPDNRTAFILSPVAIATDKQGQGIGQQLINFGIEHLKSLGVELLFTYGDPNYYSKVGFRQISQSIVKAPLKLSYPEGWLAQSLIDAPLEAMEGSSHCVKALDDQRYW